MATEKITLGGSDYTIRTFNIGELERIAEIMEGPRTKVPFAIIRIALERAEPKVEKPNDIEATTDEVSSAMVAVMKLAGLTVADPANPPGGQGGA